MGKEQELKRRFWQQVKEDRLIVATWPEWMQRIVITAKTVSTGNFIRNQRASND